uniref:Uncharacterized protein n=1 Tax=Picea glauca TaxID=3330 RepID=A0A124GNH1_PICGL|nr:hypothetical protein ABT39_MTgene4137 [Picea glauca]
MAWIGLCGRERASLGWIDRLQTARREMPRQPGDALCFSHLQES